MKAVEAAPAPVRLDAAPSPSDNELIAAVLAGNTASFEPLIARYQPRVFGVVRRYARREVEAQDIVQEIFIKAFQKLNAFRGDAPFEHWLMRIAVRTSYDYLRQHQRNREWNASDLENPEFGQGVFERAVGEDSDPERATAARQLVEAVLKQLSPAARLVITLLEVEERSVKEIAKLTGWSETLVKVRAFRARGEMKKALARVQPEKYL